MDEKYQQDYPNSHYLSNLNNLNGTNQHVDLNRLPTLGEILSNRTKSPVDLFTFYNFMREIENRVEYLDFWFDLVNHLNLCKYYVKGLRQSLLKQQNLHQQRASNLSENHKSLSSSVLLDMIINDDILQDNDSNRLSQFLRGDLNVTDPKLVDLINQYEADYDPKTQRDSGASSIPLMNSPQQQYQQQYQSQYDETFRPPSGFSSIGEKRISSQSKLMEGLSTSEDVENRMDPHYQGAGANYTQVNRDSSINPSLLEKLVKSSPHDSMSGSLITRNKLKDSTQSLLLKYFVEDAEKYLNLPGHLNQYIIKSIEIDGRDDPDIFNGVKSYIFNKIENEHLPNFLNFIAIKNLNSNFIRIIVGLFFLFIAFWIGYVLIFLDYSKSLRIPVLVPFFIGFYCLVSAIYLIDPVLVWFKRSQSFQESTRFIRLQEPFIFKLLVKRSLWTLG
ncbi:Bud site selection protein, Revert to axial protein 1 [Yamadazyma tenuis]|uniref:Bud site selection protein, Revert to axial protein 1 n=1 Tax=Candida tenuis TaxID=2315449 RepID=UPI00279F46D1|nr:Bud site selection protein, Revert to axial protein 1 [Yamadazyma tenuis]